MRFLPAASRIPRLDPLGDSMPAGRGLRAVPLLISLLVPGLAHAQTLRPEFWVPNGKVNTAAIAGNTLYIGGKFTHVGPPATAIAKVDSVTGASLPVPDVTGTVTAWEPDGSGGWFIAGKFTAVQGVP